MKKDNKSYKRVIPAEYSWRCKCGEAGIWEHKGEYWCDKCYFEMVKKGRYDRKTNTKTG